MSTQSLVSTETSSLRSIFAAHLLFRSRVGQRVLKCQVCSQECSVSGELAVSKSLRYPGEP